MLTYVPVGKKQSVGVVFLTTTSAELTKKRAPSDCFIWRFYSLGLRNQSVSSLYLVCSTDNYQPPLMRDKNRFNRNLTLLHF